MKTNQTHKFTFDAIFHNSERNLVLKGGEDTYFVAAIFLHCDCMKVYMPTQPGPNEGFKKQNSNSNN